jgi:hypothetical protein
MHHDFFLLGRINSLVETEEGVPRLRNGQFVILTVSLLGCADVPVTSCWVPAVVHFR